MYAEENHHKIIKIRSLLQQQLCYTQIDIETETLKQTLDW